MREEFRSGRLAAASSKAAALQALCDRLKFDPNEAAAINRDLFTERIETFLEDEKLTGKLHHKFSFTARTALLNLEVACMLLSKHVDLDRS